MKNNTLRDFSLGLLSGLGLVFSGQAFYKGIIDVMIDNELFIHRFVPGILFLMKILVTVLLGVYCYKRIQLSNIFSKTFIIVLISYILGDLILFSIVYVF